MSIGKIIALVLYPMILYIIYSGNLRFNTEEDEENKKISVAGWIFTIFLLWLLLRLVNK